MNQGYQSKFERMGIDQVKARMPTMRRAEKLAARQWLAQKGIEIPLDDYADMFREQVVAGAEVIIQTVRDMVLERTISLTEVSWVPDPAREPMGDSSDTYTLVLAGDQKIAQEVFSSEDLVDARGPESTRGRVRTILESVVERLEFEQLL